MKHPIIFLYSLLFPAVWIGCGLLISAFFPGVRLGTVGSMLLYCGMASLICWLFVQRHGRDFSALEYRKIIFYCIGWAWLLEFVVLLSVFTQKPGADLSIPAKCFVVLLTMTLDGLFIWLAFRNFGRRVIQSHLAKHIKSLQARNLG